MAKLNLSLNQAKSLKIAPFNGVWRGDMHYQVKIYEKKRDREHYMRDFGLTAPSRKQAKMKYSLNFHIGGGRKMRHENLLKKYGITESALKAAIDQLTLGKVFGNVTVLLALTDLIVNGDIEEEES